MASSGARQHPCRPEHRLQAFVMALGVISSQGDVNVKWNHDKESIPAGHDRSWHPLDAQGGCRKAVCVPTERCLDTHLEPCATSCDHGTWAKREILGQRSCDYPRHQTSICATTSCGATRLMLLPTLTRTHSRLLSRCAWTISMQSWSCMPMTGSALTWMQWLLLKADTLNEESTVNTDFP